MSEHAHPLSSADLSELLSYDADTGALFWKERGLHWFRDFPRKPAENSMGTWNTRYAGLETFKSKDGKGYHCGALLGKTYLAHRVIWCLVYGKWPRLVIDHINRNPTDNRLINLREVTQAQNTWNSARARSGIYPGVNLEANSGLYRARFCESGKQHELGLFRSVNDAIAAVDRRRSMTGGHTE